MKNTENPSKTSKAESFVEDELREQEIEQMLFDKGIISKIPPRFYDDEELNFMPVEIAGQPLSETIIEDRGA